MGGDSSKVQHYLVRSLVVSRRHRYRVSAYLVHRFADSVVVARIEPLGLVRPSVSDHEMALQGLRHNLRVSGRWQATASHRHTRVRLTPVDGEN